MTHSFRLLRVFALVAGARYLAETALRPDATAAEIALARFFAENCLTAAPGLADTAMNGAATLFADGGALA